MSVDDTASAVRAFIAAMVWGYGRNDGEPLFQPDPG